MNGATVFSHSRSPVTLTSAYPLARIASFRYSQASMGTAIATTAVHRAGYLVVTAAVGWLVFTKIGVGLVRHAWINLDLIWAVALIGTGILTVAV